MPPTTVLLAAALAVVLGGLIQSGVGLGLGIVASPVVTLLDPALMPGSLLVAGAALPALILAREARHTDWPGVSWALAGRLAGTAAGIDLCLHIVRRDHGADIANRVARRMVVAPHRDGGQAQFIEQPVPASANGDPIGVAIAAILNTFTLVWALTYVTNVSIIVQFLIALVGLGFAIDYALLMIFRFRDELREGADVESALVETMTHAGRSVIVSGSTVAVGLLSMLVLPLPFIRKIRHLRSTPW